MFLDSATERIAYVRTERILDYREADELRDLSEWFHGLNGVLVEGKRIALLIDPKNVSTYTAYENPVHSVVRAFLRAI